MKQIIQRPWMVMAMLSLAISSLAYDFAYNGIRYQILSSIQKTVSVVGGDFCNIPSSVEYRGVKYTVTEIGKDAFSRTQLTWIDLPETLVRISDGAFENVTTPQVEITIPDRVEIIGKEAFKGSNIEKILIGKRVSEIGTSAFENCSHLQQMIFKSNTPPSYTGPEGSLGTALDIIVPVKKWYENSALGKAIIGNMIEPISFKSDKYTYTGKSPDISVPSCIKNISGLVALEITFDAIDAGEHMAGISFYSGMFGGGQLSYNYPIEICKALLNINIEDSTREYGLPNPNLLEYTISGFVNGENEDILQTPVKLYTTADITSNVGTYPITCNPSAKNYDFQINNGELSITPANLTVIANNTSKIYGDNNPTFSATYEGFRLSDNAEISFSEMPLIESEASNSSDVGTYKISVSGGIAKNYKIIRYTSGQLTIIKAPLTLTANNVERIYYTENPDFNFTLSGLKNDDNNSCISKGPTYVCSATIDSDCGVYTVFPSNAQAKNYDITFKEGQLTINPADLILVASNISREYGDSNPILNFTAKGLKGDDTALSALDEEPIVSTTAIESSNVGEYPIIITSGASKNYSLSYKSGILTITKAPLTVIAKDAERQYGDSNPIFTRSYYGLKLDDTESTAFSLLPRLSCMATKTSNVGEYPIVVSGGISKNYEIVSYENGILNITKAPLTLTATDKSRLYFEENPSFDYTLTGLRNSDTKSCLSIQPTFKCTATKTSNVGEYEIMPFDATAQNYTIDYQKGFLSITQRALTASIGNYTKTYGTENPQFEIDYTGFVNDEDKSVITVVPDIVCPANKSSDVGTYTISLNGGEALNYVINKYNSGILTIEKADQTLAWHQDLSNIPMYSQVALEARSSAGLPVTYEMSPNNVATLYNNNGTWYLDCFGSGAVNIRAVQNGDKNHNAASMLSKTLVVMGSGVDPSNPQIFLNVENAGTLSSLIAENRKYQIKNLRLTGYLNGTDINFLREMAGSDSYGNTTPGVLETLDISGCTIISGGRSYYKSCQTSNKKVGNYMFYNCKQLVNLMLPDNTSVIEDYALADCDRLSVISIPNSVTSFGEQSFRNDISLLRIPMPTGLKSINDYAFIGCNGISELSIPANVTYIGNGIVKDCQNIAEINVVDGNNYFASKNGVLYTSDYEELLIFPVNYNSNSYTVIDETRRIAPYAFVNSKKLSNVILPTTLTSIGTDAFIGCVNLSSLQVKALTPPICDNDCFEAVSMTRCELLVPKGCYNYYWVAPVWADFNKIKESDFSDIGDIAIDEVMVAVENRSIVIRGVTNNRQVNIFQTDGTLVHQAKSDGETMHYMPAASGVYIVVIDNKTYKLMVR